MRQFGLFARDLRVQAVDLLPQLMDVGHSEGRVKRREQSVLFDHLALAHVDALDNRRIERLKHQRRIDGNDLPAGARNDPIDARDRQYHRERETGHAEDENRGADAQRLFRVTDRVDLRLELPDRGGNRLASHGRLRATEQLRKRVPPQCRFCWCQSPL